MVSIARSLACRLSKALVPVAVLCFTGAPLVRAQNHDGRPSIAVHNRDTYAAMPL